MFSNKEKIVGPNGIEGRPLEHMKSFRAHDNTAISSPNVGRNIMGSFLASNGLGKDGDLA